MIKRKNVTKEINSIIEYIKEQCTTNKFPTQIEKPLLDYYENVSQIIINDNIQNKVCEIEMDYPIALYEMNTKDKDSNFIKKMNNIKEMLLETRKIEQYTYIDFIFTIPIFILLSILNGYASNIICWFLILFTTIGVSFFEIQKVRILNIHYEIPLFKIWFHRHFVKGGQSLLVILAIGEIIILFINFPF